MNMEVQSGQTVALVGHSGCGKSTIFNLLLRYYDVEAGSIEIDGVDIRDLNIQHLRNIVGIVSQEPILFNTSIADNIRLGNERIRIDEMVNMCKLANAHDFIMDLPQGYDTVIGDGGIQLSGGQKQRIAIARALARDPRILLLDEATSALDVESEGIVRDALQKASANRTTIIIAHRLSTVKNADKIMVIDNGRVVETGNHQELLKKTTGVYKQLVESQAFDDEELVEQNEKSIENQSTEEPIDSSPSPHKKVSVMEPQRSTLLKRHTSNTSVSTDKGTLSSTADTSSSRTRKLSHKAGRKFSRAASKTDDQADRLEEEMIEEGVSKARWLEIFNEAKQDLAIWVIAVIFSILRGLMMPVFSIVFGQMFNTFSLEDEDQLRVSAFINSLAFVVLGIIQGTSAFICIALYGTSGERLTMRMRLLSMKSLLRQDVSYFDDPRHTPGKLTTRLASDAPNVKSAIDQRMASIVQGVISLVSGLAVAFFFGWQMSFITLLIYIALFATQILLNRLVANRDERDIRSAENAGKIAIESIENIRTVQALTKESYLHSLFVRSMQRTHRGQLLKAQLQSLAYGVASSLTLFISAAAYGYGVYLIGVGAMTPFRVYQVITSLNLSTMGIMNMAAYLPEIVKARMAAGLIFAIIRTQPGINVEDESGSKRVIDGNVDLRETHFAYPLRPTKSILQGVSLGTSSGKTLALVGPSGCGKSTVISLLNRFYDPTSGSVEFDTFDLRAYNLRKIREQLAMVGQEPVLFNCSIFENIVYGCESCSMDRVEAAARIAQIHDTIVKMPQRYDTIVGERGVQLSGGQKQRIAIARAIVRNPTVLLLDEATSALDSESEKLVQSALDAAAEGRTCIVVAHRLSTIQHADCIVVLQDGKVLETGTHRELIEKKGLYYSMVQKQNI